MTHIFSFSILSDGLEAGAGPLCGFHLDVSGDGPWTAISPSAYHTPPQEHALVAPSFFFKSRVNIKLIKVTQSLIHAMHLMYFEDTLKDKIYGMVGVWEHTEIIRLHKPFCYRKLCAPGPKSLILDGVDVERQKQSDVHFGLDSRPWESRRWMTVGRDGGCRSVTVPSSHA